MLFYRSICHPLGKQLELSPRLRSELFFEISNNLPIFWNYTMIKNMWINLVKSQSFYSLFLQPDGTDLFNFTDGYKSWADYLSNMEQDGTWGDHVILYGTANCYKTYIDVISSQSNHRALTIRPDGHVISTNPLVLGHVHEVHYVSLQPKQGEALCKTLCYKTVCW